MPYPGSGPPKEDDSPRSRAPSLSNSLIDQMLSTRYLPLHSRDFPVRSLLPRRTQEEQREFLASFLREAMSIIDNDFDDEDDDSADDDGNRGVSSNSSNYGDTKQ
jgi:hypothetical protein